MKMSSVKRAIAVIQNRDNLEEFRALAREAGYIIVGYVFIRRLTGGGLSDYKINEIRRVMKEYNASEVIFDVSLKPKHLYNIAKELMVEPKDRLEIILDIFELHSSSREADLQIKLASLQYELARARERVKLKKLGEQTALTVGLGAYEVDLYYNEVQRRIQNIKRKLMEERRKRDVHRIHRKKKGFKTISIAGYYSSGKTTLFNVLAGLGEKTGMEPFTTLSTKFSIVKIGPWRCYLVDTIGFISDLPPFMVSAFYSTLEEIVFSDLVLLLVDVSESFDRVRRKFLTSWEIIKALGYEGEIIVVGNKIDEVNNKLALKSISSFLQMYSERVVFISAKEAENIDDLVENIALVLGEQVYVSIVLPYNVGWARAIEFFKDKLGDYEIDFEVDGISIRGAVDSEDLWAIEKFVKGIGGRLLVEESVGVEAHT
jgi:GTP-binding protein HflX